MEALRNREGHNLSVQPFVCRMFRDFGVTLTMADGRVTGWVAKTSGTYRVATGAATALNGKSFSTVARPTGPGQFLLEITDEP